MRFDAIAAGLLAAVDESLSCLKSETGIERKLRP